jgi:MinD-like ATPase involved in chromosome partitioning or flagellar assembly
VTVLLAGPAEQVRDWYQAVMGDGRFDVGSLVDGVEVLRERLAARPPEVLVVDATLFQSPDELREAVGSLPATAVYVVLPGDVDREKEARVAELPAVKGVAKGDARLSDALDRIHGDGLAARAEPGGARHRAMPQLFSEDCPPSSRRDVQGEGRVIALWSGTAGGTGCTTLALALAGWAVEQGAGAMLLALAEPAVSAIVRCGRVPNAVAFVETGDLGAAVQTLTWGGGKDLPVVLGPARPVQGAVEAGRVAALVEAARANYPLVVVDVPTLAPGGSNWVTEPLARATDVVLVAAPTVVGVAAVLEALATLRDEGVGTRVHLVINHVVEHLSGEEFAEGVRSAWGSCPEIALEVGHVEGLPREVDGRELPHVLLAEQVSALAAAVGLAQVEKEPQETGRRPGLRIRWR